MPAARDPVGDKAGHDAWLSHGEQEATDRRPLHLAQVIQMALHNGHGHSGDYPESGYVKEKPSQPGLRDAALLGAGAVLVGSAVAWIARKVMT